MIVQAHKHQIAVKLIDSIQLEERELMFLRSMARHCVDTKMFGCNAAGRLDKLLERMGVDTYEGVCGVAGIFED